MKQGEIWLINLDPTIGAEIKKLLGQGKLNYNNIKNAGKNYRYFFIFFSS